MNRKKELKQAYLNMKKDRGVFAIICKTEAYCYLEATNDLKGTMNSALMKVTTNFHPNKGLQTSWNTYGQEGFSIEIAAYLPHPEDGSAEDEAYELSVLLLEVQEKFEREGYTLYPRRLVK